jgi:hypothetical protein
MSENELDMKFREIKFEFSGDYNRFVSMINGLLGIKNSGMTYSPLITTATVMLKPDLDKFEIDIIEFINDTTYDNNDPDLINHKNLAKQQLEHIKQLRQQIGI